ncbi:tripartite tricarboxylate transporter TctB family protein, partial [Pseudomonas aeruginosa]|nr:tripartite tricarboxylate transporter TctB family protein [Pseudomonas aeruginosa]
MTRSNLYQRLFAGLWLLACVGLAVAGWRYQAPFSYEPVGPRAYPLLCLALMGAGLGGSCMAILYGARPLPAVVTARLLGIG